MKSKKHTITVAAALATVAFGAMTQTSQVHAAPKKANTTDKSASSSETVKLITTKANLEFKLQALKGDNSTDAKLTAANLKSQVASIDARLPKAEKKAEKKAEVKTAVSSAAAAHSHAASRASSHASSAAAGASHTSSASVRTAPKTTTSNASNIAGIRGKLVAKAKSYLGIPYVWGGTNPSVGLDCSGLTSLVYGSFGYNIGRTTYNQDVTGRHVPLSALKPGDLILEYGKGHVTMYIGGGQQIEAPQPGDVVKISSVPYASGAMYGLRYVND